MNPTPDVLLLQNQEPHKERNTFLRLRNKITPCWFEPQTSSFKHISALPETTKDIRAKLEEQTSHRIVTIPRTNADAAAGGKGAL